MATFALRKFLYSGQIKGNLSYGCWRVSCVAFVLSGREVDGAIKEGNSTRKKRKRNETGSSSSSRYEESIPFLRNGFFQDAALVSKDPDNARILVGSVAHLEKSLKSEAEVIATARALSAVNNLGRPSGKDAEILSRVENLVNRNHQLSTENSMTNLASIMIGAATYEPPGDCTSEEQLKSLRVDLTKLVRCGGSIAHSTALHVACAQNSIKVAKLLLQMDTSSSKSKDHLGRTPLMVAAINASGRLSINGIDDTAVIDTLLEFGANKAEVDSSNMTAYGYFKKASTMHIQITRYQHRRKLTDLEHKLYPPGGPTVMDFSEGRGGTSGIVDYGPEDDEADREMGRGVYASNDDDSGDY